MSPSPTCAERLRLALARSNRKPTDLAREINRQPRTVINWCKGETQPNASDIAACCDALDVSADWLVGRVDSPTGLTPGTWVIDSKLLAHARTHPRDSVVPGFQVPERHVIVTDAQAKEIQAEVQQQRRRGRPDAKA